MSCSLKGSTHSSELIEVVSNCGDLKFNVCNICAKNAFAALDSRLVRSYNDYENNKAVLDRVITSLNHHRFMAAISSMHDKNPSKCSCQVYVANTECRLKAKANRAYNSLKFGSGKQSNKPDTNAEQHANYKSQMCRFGTDCKFGTGCSYAHSLGTHMYFNR